MMDKEFRDVAIFCVVAFFVRCRGGDLTIISCRSVGGIRENPLPALSINLLHPDDGQ